MFKSGFLTVILQFCLILLHMSFLMFSWWFRSQEAVLKRKNAKFPRWRKIFLSDYWNRREASILDNFRIGTCSLDLILFDYTRYPLIIWRPFSTSSMIFVLTVFWCFTSFTSIFVFLLILLKSVTARVSWWPCWYRRCVWLVKTRKTFWDAYLSCTWCSNVVETITK